MPIAVFWIELSDAHKACQRVIHFAAQFKRHGRGRELLDRLLGPILFLQQQPVSRDAFRRLLMRFQKPRVQRQRFGLFAGGRKPVEKHSVINRRAVVTILKCVQIPQGLDGFQMIWKG